MRDRVCIVLLLLQLMIMRSFAQESFVRSDTCSIFLPLKVYYRDNGLHFISDCQVIKFNIVIWDLKGHRIWKKRYFRRDKGSYYIKLRRYRTGMFKWNIKYTMLINGDRINKETFGTAEFLN
jgi:hypothetical protein